MRSDVHATADTAHLISESSVCSTYIALLVACKARNDLSNFHFGSLHSGGIIARGATFQDCSHKRNDGGKNSINSAPSSPFVEWSSSRIVTFACLNCLLGAAAIMVPLFVLFIAVLVCAYPACAYPPPGPCTGNCWTHDLSLIQRESDGMYFRFSTGTGVNTMTSPSLKGPWVDRGAALPDGSIIKLDGAETKRPWVCESNPH